MHENCLKATSDVNNAIANMFKGNMFPSIFRLLHDEVWRQGNPFHQTIAQGIPCSGGEVRKERHRVDKIGTIAAVVAKLTKAVFASASIKP